MLTHKEGYWTVREAARAWGISPSRVLHIIKQAPKAVKNIAEDGRAHWFIPVGTVKPTADRGKYIRKVK